MLNNTQLAILNQGYVVWNAWRIEHANETVNLFRADLSGTDLSMADISQADLYEANLSNANLRASNLREANLRFANIGGADLRGADLRRADLRRANLREAKLRGANLSYADLSYADLCGVRMNWQSSVLIAERLRQASYGCYEYLAFAGYVYLSGKCWADYERMAVPLDVSAWALTEIQTWLHPDDELPPELVRALKEVD